MSSAGKRNWAIVAGSTLATAAVCIISLPWILSSQMGARWIEQTTLKKTGIALQIHSLNLSWLGPQVIEGIDLTLEDHSAQIACQQLDISASLLQLLFKRDVGTATLSHPQLLIKGGVKKPITYAPEPFQAASFTPHLALAIQLQRWSGQFLIEQGDIAFTDPLLSHVRFKQIAMKLSLEKQISAELTALTSDGATDGNIMIHGTLSDPEVNALAYQLHFDIKHLPIQGVDRCLSILFPRSQGLLPALIGPTLDIQADMSGARDSMAIQASAISPLIHIEIEGLSADSAFSLKKPLIIEGQLTPEFITFLSSSTPALTLLSLHDPAKVTLSVSTLSMPLPLKRELAEISFEASLALNSHLSGTFHGTPFSLNTLSLSSSTTALNKQLELSARSELLAQGKTGTFTANGQLSDLFSEKPQILGSLQTTQFPLILFSAIGIDLEPILGDNVDMTLSMDTTKPSSQGQFTWHSSRLDIPTAQFSFKERLELLAPLSFDYDLAATSMLHLSHITPIHGEITTFSFDPSHLEDLQLEAKLSCEEATFTLTPAQTLRSAVAALSIQGFNTIAFSLRSDTLSASIKGSLNANLSTLTLTTPLTLLYHTTGEELPWLTSPATLQATIDPTTIALHTPLTSSIKGHLFIEELSVRTPQAPIVLGNNAIAFQYAGASGALDLQLSSHLSSQKTDFIQGTSHFSSLSLATMTVETNLQCHHCPTSLLAVIGSIPTLPQMLGDTFDATLSLHSSPQEGKMSIQWQSPLLQFSTAWLMNPQGFTLQNPTTLSWTLSPTAHAAIASAQSSPFYLQDSIPVTIALSKCSLPVQEGGKRLFLPAWQWDQIDLMANTTMVGLSILDSSAQEEITLPTLKAALYKSAGKAPLQLSIDATTLCKTVAAQKAGMLTLSFLYTPAPAWDLLSAESTLLLKAEQFPTKLLDFATQSLRDNTQLATPFSSTFGNYLQLSINTSLKELSGPISLLLNSPTAQLQLDGHLVSGALLLDKPFYSQFALTAASSQFLLQQVNPLKLSAIQSQNPVKLSVADKGFYLPLHPFALEKMTIPAASIDLGRLICRNEGNLNIAMGLLKANSSSKDLHLWFTPLDVSMTQGVATLERAEILLSDAYHLCLFGNVDFVKDWVDLKLGFTAEALDRAFGIKNLPENYVLTIPLKGKINDVQIDTGKATAKMALLLAWQNKVLSGLSGGSPFGALADELVGAIATLPDANAKIPPAKRPFPWEKEPLNPARKSKKKAFKPSDKPAKQLMKVIR